MPAQYIQLDGRHWCNEDFVNKVRDLYPATTKKIPLGYSTYTGWTGKDEVLFTAHEHLDDEAKFDGQLFEASFDDVGADNFRDKILEIVDYVAPPKPSKKQSSDDGRQRKQATLDQSWGSTLEERISKIAKKQEDMAKKAARGKGLYGYPRPIQSTCETAIKRINRRAAKLMHKAIKKDRHLVPFLQAHASQGRSTAARVLLSAYKASMPQAEWHDDDGESAEFDFGLNIAEAELGLVASDKTAADKEAAPRWGMYGYPRRTVRAGLAACTAVREAAGFAAADIHRRKTALHGRVTGFLGEHSKVGKCYASKLILTYYPAMGFKFRRASEEAPKTVDGWLTWDGDF